MHPLSRRSYGRIAQALTFLTLSCALSVQAAPSKKPAKKQVAASVSKRVAKEAPRKRVVVKSQRKQAAVAKAPSSRGKQARSARTPVRAAAASAAVAATAVAIARPSFGQMAGLHTVNDPLDLKSSVALVMDQDTKEVLLSKNDHAVLPIASLTKLMTGLLISEAKLPSNEHITITQDDVDTEKHSSSRLRVGTTLTRGEMLHLALMSSENRATHALGRTYPGGINAFVQQMNAKAKLLGMGDTRFVEPTGLSSSNQSSARDLAVLVNVTHADPLLRELSTSPGYEVAVGNRTLQFNNTNRLVKSDNWDIGLQKTGFINEAGKCLVMQAQVSGRKLIMVFLDSSGRFTRLADAERVRNWVESKGSHLTRITAVNTKG